MSSHHGSGQDGGHALQVRLRRGRQPVAHPRQQGEDVGRRHRLRPGQLHEGLRRLRRRGQVGRQDPARGQDGHPRRRPSGRASTSSTPRPTRRRRPGRSSRPATTRPSPARRTARSSSRTPTTRCASPTSSCSAVEQDRRLAARTRSRPARSPAPTRRATSSARMAEAAWICGDPGIQYDTTINDWHTCANTDRIYASNPCSEYMFLNDTACNLASLNLMKFVREDGEFDVEAYRLRLPPDDHGAGDPGRQRELPDAADRGELAPLPAARAGLRQPGRAAHEPRPGLRLRRGTGRTRPP